MDDSSKAVVASLGLKLSELKSIFVLPFGFRVQPDARPERADGILSNQGLAQFAFRCPPQAVGLPVRDLLRRISKSSMPHGSYGADFRRLARAYHKQGPEGFSHALSNAMVDTALAEAGWVPAGSEHAFPEALLLGCPSEDIRDALTKTLAGDDEISFQEFLDTIVS